MKSPFTGKDMTLYHERRTFTFRNKEFEVIFCFYKNPETGEQFTTTELDEINTLQVYNQYRSKYEYAFDLEI